MVTSYPVFCFYDTICDSEVIMKNKSFLVFFVLLAAISVFAQQNDNGAHRIINHYAARDFLAGSIPKGDLDLIIQAGIKAPRANNRQPWHFTVVQNPNLAKRIVSTISEGNVLIVISGDGDGKTNGRVILDCALATESIYLAAQALGYGSRIYTGPMDALNRDLKGDLDLPKGYSAVALVRVGLVKPGVDAVSAASGRKNEKDVVTYK
jgi:nitroreductase